MGVGVLGGVLFFFVELSKHEVNDYASISELIQLGNSHR